MENVFTLALAEITTIWGILLYWVPLLMCAVGYLFRTVSDVSSDVKNRERLEQAGKSADYYPTVRIGTLIGRGLVSIIPVANLLAAIFDVSPEIFGNFFKTLGKIFNQPLVPGRKVEPKRQAGPANCNE
jgi:hypothetical protein